MLISQRRELLKLHPVLSWKLLANSFLIYQRFGIQDKSRMVAEGEHISEMRKKNIFELILYVRGEFAGPRSTHPVIYLEDLLYGRILFMETFRIFKTTVLE